MSRARYYRRDGKPIGDVLTWARLFENAAYKRVAETFLDDGTRISTVWMGLDHSFVEIYGDDRPPLIFESMVFSPETKVTLDKSRESGTRATKLYFRGEICGFFPLERNHERELANIG